MCEGTVVGRYLGWLKAQRGLHFDGYWDLWRWSVTDLDAFWSTVWDFFGVTAANPPKRILASAEMPGAVAESIVGSRKGDEGVRGVEIRLDLAVRRAVG